MSRCTIRTYLPKTDEITNSGNKVLRGYCILIKYRGLEVWNTCDAFLVR